MLRKGSISRDSFLFTTLNDALVESTYNLESVYSPPTDTTRGSRFNRYDAERAISGLMDYSLSHKSFGLGGAEFNGRRVAGSFIKPYEEAFHSYPRSQEDRIAFDEIPDFGLLSPTLQDQVIQQTINDLQFATSAWPNTGSCLLTNIIVPDLGKNHYTIVTINLGDSLSLFTQVQVDAPQSAKQFERISQQQLNVRHIPANHSEKIRLQAFPNAVTNGRINGVLTVSRAMGNDRFKKCGLSHQAEITRHDVPMDDTTHRNYIITACDGLDEHPSMTLTVINDIVLSNLTEPRVMACKLARTAIIKESEDNVSVLVLPLNFRDTPLQKPLAISIYDGHGGAEVAALLQRKFLAYLAAYTAFTLHKEVGETIASPAQKSKVDYSLLMQYTITIQQAMRALTPFHYYKLIKLADLIRLDFEDQRHRMKYVREDRLFRASYDEDPQYKHFKELLAHFKVMAETVKISESFCYSAQDLSHIEQRDKIIHLCDEYLKLHQRMMMEVNLTSSAGKLTP